MTAVPSSSNLTLNVRRDPGVEGEIIDELETASEVRTTGNTAVVGNSTWYEVETSVGTGWVNGYYLTPATPDAIFPGDQHALEAVAEFARRLRHREDFTDLVSWRGLHISFYDDPIRYAPAEIAGLYDDPTPMWWESPAMTKEEIEEMSEPSTFREGVVDSFLEVYYDNHIEISTDFFPERGAWRVGRDPHLAGFSFVDIYDEGDLEGISDHRGWAVSLSSEGDEIRVVALSHYYFTP